MTRDDARQWAKQDKKQSAQIYNTTNFPILVAHHGNWDIYRNAAGHCAAIPVVEGCRASHFGDMNYLKHVPDLIYVTLIAPPDRDKTPHPCSISSISSIQQPSSDIH